MDPRNTPELQAAAPDLLDALVTLLNIEAPARRGGELPVFNGLDVAYHFEKARAAILRATSGDLPTWL